MSQGSSPGGLREVLGRALNDPAYRDLLFSDPDAALPGYSLTPEEMTTLKGITRQEFDEQAEKLSSGFITDIAWLQPPPPGTHIP